MSRKESRVLALDLGQAAFKLALGEVREDRVMLTRIRLVELPEQAGPEARQEALKALLEGVDPAQPDEVVSVVDDPFACFREIWVPPMSSGELSNAVRWEMQRFLAVPPEQAAVGHRLLGEGQRDGVKKLRLLAVALPAEQIQSQLEFLGKAGIRPTRLVPKGAALGQWLERGQAAREGKPLALLEVGSSGCDFFVFRAGFPLFSRKIPGGARLLTREMTGLLMTERGQVSLSPEEAESFKRDTGIPRTDGPGLAAKGISAMQIFSLMRGGLERMISEVERSLAFYRESGGQEPVERLLLVGGGAHLKGLPEWLQVRLAMSVELPRPLEGFALVSPEVVGGTSAMELTLGPVLGAVCAGKGEINLLPEPLRENLSRDLRKAALKGAAAAALLSAGLLWIGMQVYRQTLSKKIAALEVEQAALASRLPTVRPALAAHDRLEGQPDWEDLFRDLTHRVPRQVVLTDWSVQEGKVAFHGRIRKGGSSPDEVLAEFMRALGEGHQTEVILRSRRQVSNGSDLAEFELECRLR